MRKICVPSETLLIRKRCLPCRVALGNGWPCWLCALGAEGTLKKLKDGLLTFCELVTYCAGVLLLPCAVTDILFGWGLFDILLPTVLVAVLCTLILTGVALHQGWYYDHLSGWGFDSEGVEPTLPPKEGGTDVAPLTRPNLAKAILGYQSQRRRPNSGERVSARDRASPASRPVDSRAKFQNTRSDGRRS